MKFFYIFIFLLCAAFSGRAQVAGDSVKLIDRNKTAEDSVYVHVEQEAVFPGGGSAWIKYLQLNLDPSIPVKNAAPQGSYRVIVRFIVRKDGTIDNILAETSFGYGMEEEAVRIIKKGPKWIPANKDGAAVNAYRRQQITFVLQEN
jgi:protein TonB